MSEACDFTDPEIQVLCEGIETESVFRGLGRIRDLFQSFLYCQAVFELAPVGWVDVVRVEERTLKFFTQEIMVAVLFGC